MIQPPWYMSPTYKESEKEGHDDEGLVRRAQGEQEDGHRRQNYGNVCNHKRVHLKGYLHYIY